MVVGSKRILQLLAERNDDRDMVILDQQRKPINPRFPRMVLDDFLSQELVEEDASRPGHGIIYRLTDDGRKTAA
jgi:hypothetical protein